MKRKIPITLVATLTFLASCGGQKDKCRNLDQEKYYNQGYYHGQQRVKSRLAKIPCDKVFEAVQRQPGYLGNENKECFCWGYDAAFK